MDLRTKAGRLYCRTTADSNGGRLITPRGEILPPGMVPDILLALGAEQEPTHHRGSSRYGGITYVVGWWLTPRQLELARQLDAWWSSFDARHPEWWLHTYGGAATHRSILVRVAEAIVVGRDFPSDAEVETLLGLHAQSYEEWLAAVEAVGAGE